MKSLCSASQPGVFAVMALLATSYVRADVTGAILGTVTDPTGAVIVAAHVALRNQNTGLNRSAATDQNGNYQFLQVPVGQDYVVEVEAAGLSRVVQAGFGRAVARGIVDHGAEVDRGRPNNRDVGVAGKFRRTEAGGTEFHEIVISLDYQGCRG